MHCSWPLVSSMPQLASGVRRVARADQPSHPGVQVFNPTIRALWHPAAVDVAVAVRAHDGGDWHDLAPPRVLVLATVALPPATEDDDGSSPCQTPDRGFASWVSMVLPLHRHTRVHKPPPFHLYATSLCPLFSIY